MFAKVKLDLRRLLHGGQEYVFHGPPPDAGTELTVQTRVDKIYEKEGKRGGTMTFVVTVTEFRDADAARVVAEARTTTIETGKPATDGGCVMADLGRPARSAPRPSRARVRPAHPHRLRAVPGRVGRLQPDPPRRGVRASRPGYPTVFSVGMLQAGILAGFATDWLGARQRAPVRRAVPRAGVAGRRARLHAARSSTRSTRTAASARVDLELARARAVGGGAAIKGEATFVVPCARDRP